jgi:hypothetical protein
MYEMKLIFIVKRELLYKDSEFFSFQNWKVHDIHEDHFNTVTLGILNFKGRGQPKQTLGT